MTETRNTDETRAKLWAMMGKFQAAMLVTRSPSGTMAARPMSPIVEADEGLIYILTEKGTETVLSVESDPAALLTFADGKRYISVAAEVSVSGEQQLIDRLWNAGAQAFWPDDPSDPRICALVLKPSKGEFWDGDNTFATAIQIVIGQVTGKQPEPGEHGEVRL